MFCGRSAVRPNDSLAREREHSVQQTMDGSVVAGGVEDRLWMGLPVGDGARSAAVDVEVQDEILVQGGGDEAAGTVGGDDVGSAGMVWLRSGRGWHGTRTR